MTTTDLADAHLTYVAFGPSAYAVYLPEHGTQLGTVEKSPDGLWVACEEGPPRRFAGGQTRWEAAIRLWPAESI